MWSLVLAVTLAVFHLNLGVSATPVSPEVGKHIPISRYRPRSTPATGGSFGGVNIFDLDFGRNQLLMVSRKYRKASEMLPNVVPHLVPTMLLSFHNNSSIDLCPRTSADMEPQEPFPLPVQMPFNTMPMKDYIYSGSDLLYYGTVEVGSPPQALTVDIDTGSADLWIPGGCGDCEQNQFQPSLSTTYQRKRGRFEVIYASGTASGVLASDDITISGLTVSNQTFGLVSYESDEFDDYPNDGLLGLAFGSISTSRSRTFFENLMAERKVNPWFSIFLTRGVENGSEVCFGCIDPTKSIGDITWIPLVSKTYWTIKMDALFHGELELPLLSNNMIAAIDSGTTLIYLHETIATAFYNMIPGGKQWTPGFYTFPCALAFDVGIVFGGKKFVIDRRDFNLGMAFDDSPDCVGGILSFDDASGIPANLAIIGDEFLKSWYSVYDYSHDGRIGFSKSMN